MQKYKKEKYLIKRHKIIAEFFAKRTFIKTAFEEFESYYFIKDIHSRAFYQGVYMFVRVCQNREGKFL